MNSPGTATNDTVRAKARQALRAIHHLDYTIVFTLDRRDARRRADRSAAGYRTMFFHDRDGNVLGIYADL